MLALRWPALVLVATLSGAALQNPEELLRRADIGAFAPSSFRARLLLQSLPHGVSHEIEIWRSGDAKTLIRFLDVRDAGKYLLRLDGQIWLLTPGAKKPIHVSASYRLYGGATLDEVLGIRLARAYQVNAASRADDPAGAVVTLELQAKSEGMLFPHVRYAIREATGRPVSATYQLRSGRDATAVEFLEWNEGRLIYARRVVVKDLLRKGALTQVDITELQEQSIADALFSLDDASARHRLEAAKTTNR